MKILLSFSVWWALVVPPAWADSVELKEKGTIDGTLEAIVLVSGGKKQSYGREKLVAVRLGKEGRDSVHWEGGGSAKGAITAVGIRTTAGLLTFERDELKAVSVATPSEEAIRKEYRAKRRDVKDDDARGLYALGVWCKEKGLVPEARELARACLKAKPAPEIEVLAHRLAGHVLRDGEWVEPAMLRVPKELTPEPNPEPGNTTRTRTSPGKTRMELCKKLAEEYAEKAKAAETQEREGAKKTYLSTLESAQSKCQNFRKMIDSDERRRSDLRRSLRSELNDGSGDYPNNPQTKTERERKRRIDDLRDNLRQLKSRLKKNESEYEKSAKKLVALKKKARAAVSKVKSNRQKCEQRLTLARSKVERLLFVGRALSEAEMRAIFDEALGTSKESPKR